MEDADEENCGEIDFFDFCNFMVKRTKQEEGARQKAANFEQERNNKIKKGPQTTSANDSNY